MALPSLPHSTLVAAEGGARYEDCDYRYTWSSSYSSSCYYYCTDSYYLENYPDRCER